MPETVICFDFDGTLVDEDGKIHPSDVEILKHDTSFIFVAATGRPLRSVRHAFASHGLFTDEVIQIPLVLENGGVVYDAHERLKDRFPFSVETKEVLLRVALDAPDVTFMVHSSDDVRNLWPSELGRSMDARFHLNAAPFSSVEEVPDLIKLTAISDDRALLDELYDRTSDVKMERAYSLPTVLEFTPPGVDKGRGLSSLMGDLLGDRRLIVVGDGGNDLPLFSMADLSFAPSDSQEDVRSVADHVVDRTLDGVFSPILEMEAVQRGSTTS